MNDAQLQIVISAVNNATAALETVGEQLEGLGTTAQEAGSAISAALTPAEEAVANQAQIIADNWDTTMNGVSDATYKAAATLEGAFLPAVDTLAQSFNSFVADVDQAYEEMAEAAGVTAAEMQAAWESAMGEMEEETASSVGSMHGYFRQLIAAYALVRVGQAGLGQVEGDVSAAAGNPDKIANLKDQVASLTAEIAKNEASLDKASGTTAQTVAAHEAARAAIEKEKDQIAQLNQQLTPLENAQKIAGDSATQYDAAVLKLTNDWEAFQATQGSTILPLLTKLATVIDDIVEKMTSWADAHPKLTEAMLIFTAVVSELLIIVGSLMAAFVIGALVFTMLGATVVTVGGIIILAFAAIVAAVVTNWAAIKKETLQLISDFEAAWNALATWWDKLWDGLFNTLNSYWTSKIQPIVSTILSAIKSVAGFIGSAAGAVGGAISSAASAVTHVQDAIITPSGQVIQTDVNDYLMATKNPGGIGGGGSGGITININGGSYLNQGGATQIANALAEMINRQLKLKRVA